MGGVLDVLPFDVWSARAAAHEAAVAERTAARLARRDRGLKHPVEDFLFDYYGFAPGRLSRWHPGPGVGLAGAAGMPRASWRWYVPVGDVVTLDERAFLAERRHTVEFVRDVVSATLSRPPALGCFGLHEWAMVYGIPADGVRHEAWPLRLGSAGSDAVTRTHAIRCTHFDAYRFFTPSAAPLNALQPTRATQVDLEQPGCLHAGMDLYKWCYTLEPVVPSRLTLAAFELAREIRILDMQASPYDLSALGYEPVAVETAAGRAAYVDAQRAFTERANAVRRSLLDVLQPLAEAAGRTSASAR